ncbi:uncharacterized protein [Aristolochia californica]|uniref:uncharacterized protein n=1 Tax=Aristolochia californica TaxID=171875 RepID=UPI0035DF0801
MIDVVSGGPLVDKTPEAARNLIANMVANSEQFGTRLDLPSKNVNEVKISSLEQLIASLTSLVRQMVVGNTQMAKACGICSVVGHPTDMCPTLQEEPTEQETRANIKSLVNQMGQMATAISRLEAQSLGKLPSQTVINPRETASAIILRSGKEVEIPVKAAPASLEQEKEKNVIAKRNIPNDDDVPMRNFPPLSDYKPVPPFPQALADSRKDEQNKGLHETFRRCEDEQIVPVLLGRPFLKTFKTRIDVHSGTVTMEFDGEIVKFNIYDAMKYPSDDNHVYFVDVIDSFTHEVFELDGKDELEVAISKHLEKENEELALSSDLQEIVAALNDIPQLQHSKKFFILSYQFLARGLYPLFCRLPLQI